MIRNFNGSCLCGVCRYHISFEEEVNMFLCHCRRCQKETGTVHGANIFFKHADLKWLTGEEMLTRFKLKGTRKERQFCKVCGSPMPWEMEGGQVVLPAGSLDNEPELTPTAHIFCDSRASWEDKLKVVKQFSEFPS